MIIFKIITGLVVATTLALTGYLYQLLEETDYLEQAAAISGESVMSFHIAAIIVIAWLVFCLIKKAISTTLLLSLLIIILGIEGTFLSMDLNESVSELIEYTNY